MSNDLMTANAAPIYWRSIVGYEQTYEASNDGRIRRKAGSFSAPQARELKQYRHRTGYLMVRLYSGARGTGVGKYVHRLVAEAHYGPIPSGLQVNHCDGDKSNNNLSNLEYVTAAENIAHAEKMGLRPKAKGEAHGHSRLTEIDVLLIRANVDMGFTQREVAKKYGIGESHVHRIVTRKAWRHI